MESKVETENPNSNIELHESSKIVAVSDESLSSTKNLKRSILKSQKIRDTNNE